MDSKKRSVGASEREEFLRAAWRAMVAGQARIYAERLVFLRRTAPPTPRWHPCTLGLGEESERFARCHASIRHPDALHRVPERGGAALFPINGVLGSSLAVSNTHATSKSSHPVYKLDHLG